MKKPTILGAYPIGSFERQYASLDEADVEICRAIIRSILKNPLPDEREPRTDCDRFRLRDGIIHHLRFKAGLGVYYGIRMNFLEGSAKIFLNSIVRYTHTHADGRIIPSTIAVVEE